MRYWQNRKGCLSTSSKLWRLGRVAPKDRPGAAGRSSRSGGGAGGGTATQVLSAAAVIGRSFHLHLVHGTSGRSEDETIGALEELVRRGIVRELGGSPEAAFG